MSNKLSREFIAERDYRIWQARAAGLSPEAIAKQYDISMRAVSSAVSRQARKLNEQAAYSYPEVLRLELERLDDLQRSVWPLAHQRKVVLDDGTEMVIEPDLKAVETLLKIQQQRAKLLGMEVNRVSIDSNVDIRHNMHGVEDEEATTGIDQRKETQQMLELMAEARILEPDTVKAMLNQLGEGEENIVDVEVVDDSE